MISKVEAVGEKRVVGMKVRMTPPLGVLELRTWTGGPRRLI